MYRKVETVKILILVLCGMLFVGALQLCKGIPLFAVATFSTMYWAQMKSRSRGLPKQDESLRTAIYY